MHKPNLLKVERDNLTTVSIDGVVYTISHTAVADCSCGNKSCFWFAEVYGEPEREVDLGSLEWHHDPPEDHMPESWH